MTGEDPADRRPLLRGLCHVGAAIAIVGAGAYLLFGKDKGLGIFLALVAAITARVLILNVAAGLDERVSGNDEPG